MIQSAAVPAPAASEPTLVQAWIGRRDEVALSTLFARHESMVRAVAGRILHDRSDVDEVVQEVFSSLAEDLEEVRGPVGAWLRRVAANAALSRLRSMIARRERESVAAVDPRLGPQPPGDAAADEEQRRLVAACVAELTPAERELVVRLFWCGESQRDLARRLVLSHTAVQKRLTAVLDRLRRQLHVRGVRLAPVLLLSLLLELGGQEGDAAARIRTMASPTPAGGWRRSMVAAGAVVAVALLIAPAALAGKGSGPPAGSPVLLITSERMPDPVPGAMAAAPGLPPAQAPSAEGPVGAAPSWWQDAPEGWVDGNVGLACLLRLRPSTEPGAVGSKLHPVPREQITWRVEGEDLTVIPPSPYIALLAIRLPRPFTEAGVQFRLDRRDATGVWHHRLCTLLAVSRSDGPWLLSAVSRGDGRSAPVVLDRNPYDLTGLTLDLDGTFACLKPRPGAQEFLLPELESGDAFLLFTSRDGSRIRRPQTRMLPQSEIAALKTYLHGELRRQGLEVDQ
ncbi:MAG: sigma-70 family RNA polymerase sigma factor [Planctomycetes bacterium]|nr:sigma-70 family RNA polymerase sigma factor [Planctomycetota bacterium]